MTASIRRAQHRLVAVTSNSLPDNPKATKLALGLGANLGQAADTVRSTLIKLSAWSTVTQCLTSSLYKTSPIDAQGEDYVNAVALLSLSSPRSVFDLLADCQALENQAGRTRAYRNAPRTLDVDILLAWNDEKAIELTHPFLQLPHPRMHERAFVLVPLAELDPSIVIPRQGNLLGLLPPVSQQRISILHA